MIEKITIKHLSEFAGSVPVCGEVPEKPPATYIIVEKTGAGEKDKINSAAVIVQSYAATMQKAAELNEAVKKWMKLLSLRPEVSACKLDSDYNYTDTTKKEYRYQAVFDVTYF